MSFRPILALALIFVAALTGSPALAAPPALELQVDLDPATRQLKVQALVTPASQDFYFALHESLDIAAANSDGKPLGVLPAGREGALRVWHVTLPTPESKLHLDYGGTLPALDRSLDHRGVLRSLPPMTAVEGSFLPAGGGWYPQPAPLFPYRVALSVPAGQRALVPGRLQSEDVPEVPERRYRAVFEFPHPADGIDLMAGPWVVREKTLPQATGEAIRLRTYFPRELDAQAGLADGYLDDTRRYLELYSAEIGAYPFTEFSVVASPLPTGFGMPTLTYLGAEVLRLPFIRATSLGHEVLHNWWGNGVYVDYAKGNWCEGLTTFMADYAYKERDSAATAREMRLGWLRDFAAVPAGSHQSLASFRSRTHGAAAAVGYGKSAMVFLMLRDAIGDDAFRQGLRNFWEKHRFQVATWEDLRATFEKASGRSLAVFFDQWVNRAGGPAVKILHAEAQSADGTAHLSLALGQSQPAYALRLPVEVSYAGRSESRWVEFADASGSVALATDGRPAGVRLDPDLRVWRRLEPEQLPPILRQWIISASPRLALASTVGEVNEAGLSLGKRLFEAAPRTVSADELKSGTDPILLIGLHGEIDEALTRTGLPPRPANLARRGSAQVWTIQTEGGVPVAVASVRDAEALRALQRPLPHYGSQSWLVFEGSRAADKGVWPAPGRLMPVEQGH